MYKFINLSRNKKIGFTSLVLILLISAITIFVFWEKISGNYHYYSSVTSLPYFEINFDKENSASLNGQLEELNQIERANLPYTGVKHEVFGFFNHGNNGKKIEAKIVGMYNDHWQKDKPSLKISSVNNDKLINDLYSFGLLNPKTRDFLGDWIASEFEKNLELLNLKREFVLANIDNKGSQVYLIEESFRSFSKRQNNGLTFSYSTNNGIVKIKIYNDEYDYSLKKEIEDALTKFIAVPEKNISIFNLEKMALFYGLNDLVQGFHQLIEFNTHLFYDFQSKKIEAIGREWNSNLRIEKEKILTIDYVKSKDSHNSILHSKIFSSKKFIKTYNKALSRVSKIDLKDFFIERDEKIDLFTKCLWKDRGSLQYDIQYIYDNMEFLRANQSHNF